MVVAAASVLDGPLSLTLLGRAAVPGSPVLMSSCLSRRIN